MNDIDHHFKEDGVLRQHAKTRVDHHTNVRTFRQRLPYDVFRGLPEIDETALRLRA